MERVIRRSSGPCCAFKKCHTPFTPVKASLPPQHKVRGGCSARPLDAARCWLARRRLASSVRRSCDQRVDFGKGPRCVCSPARLRRLGRGWGDPQATCCVGRLRDAGRMRGGGGLLVGWVVLMWVWL